MLLMRHAESEFNAGLHDRPDPGLSERGAEMAHNAAAVHRDSFLTIMCSPYRRALQTARIFADASGAPIRVNPLIGEYVSGPHEAGSPVSVLEKEFPELDFRACADKWWADAETEDEVRDRGNKFSEWAVNELGAGVWLVVSHFGFIRILTGAVLPNLSMVRINPPREMAA